MADVRLGAVEAHFADLIWANEPLTSRELVEICQKDLNWKRTTTYTVLKKLCEKGLFHNENAVVTSIVSREEFYAMQSEQFVNETFQGSLPAFIAAFATRKSFSAEEIAEIHRMIDTFGEEK